MGNSPRCLEFAILSAARTSEALTAQWTEFDRQARTWTIPAAKMKCRERHVVYLNGLPPLHRRECIFRPASPRSLGRNQANRDPRGSPFLKSYSSETSSILWRLAVHGLQPAVRVGEGRRHVHFAADDFDIGSGFAGAGRLHRFIELAKRGHPRCIPIRASERLRQFSVVPRCEIVVVQFGFSSSARSMR